MARIEGVSSGLSIMVMTRDLAPSLAHSRRSYPKSPCMLEHGRPGTSSNGIPQAVMTTTVVRPLSAPSPRPCAS